MSTDGDAAAAETAALPPDAGGDPAAAGEGEGNASIAPPEGSVLLSDDESVDSAGPPRGGGDKEGEGKPSIKDSRRAGVDHNMDITLALMKRVKKVSIELPLMAQHGRRLQKIILGVDACKHIAHETKGGKYGVPSRPDLETQDIAFPTQPDSDIVAFPPSLTILYSGGRNAFIMSAMQEEELLMKLKVYSPSVGEITKAFIMVGERKLNVLSSAKQRVWRKFVNMYMFPLLEDANRMSETETRLKVFVGLDADATLGMEHKVYGGDEKESIGESSDDDEESVHKKSKKKNHHGKHKHGHKTVKK
jgi:hypothetical protein